MIKFITLSRLTDKGRTLPPEKAPESLAKVTQIVQHYGGHFIDIFATTGKYDFISLVEYPDEESGFKAHTKITELGLMTLESSTYFPIDKFIEASLESKELVAV
jgi:uncharacterized protein with GYD domain